MVEWCEWRMVNGAVIADGKLYIREDWFLWCYDIRESKKSQELAKTTEAKR